MTVKMAAMKAWSISMVKGRTPQKMENTDSTTITSCTMAMRAPSPYCHFRNRKKMYKKMMIKEKMVAFWAPLRKSSEMVLSTLLYMSTL